MNRTNLSLHDRASLNRLITFLDESLAEDNTMSKPIRKRTIAYQSKVKEALELVELHLTNTGGTFTHDAEESAVV